MKSKKILVQAMALLRVRAVESQELPSLLRHLSDTILLEDFGISDIVSDLQRGTCSQKAVSNYAKMLEVVKQDSQNIKRDEAFPLSLTIASKVLLSLYLFDDRIAEEETMISFMPTAEKLIAENKVKWLKILTPTKAMEELEELVKLATYQELSCSGADISKHSSFEEFGAAELDMALIAQKLDSYLGIDIIVDLMTTDVDITVEEYAEKLYHCVI